MLEKKKKEEKNHCRPARGQLALRLLVKLSFSLWHTLMKIPQPHSHMQRNPCCANTLHRISESVDYGRRISLMSEICSSPSPQMTPAVRIDSHVALLCFPTVGDGSPYVYRHLDALISLSVLKPPAHRLSAVHFRGHNKAKTDRKAQDITWCCRAKSAYVVEKIKLSDKMAQNLEISVLTDTMYRWELETVLC